LAAGYVTWSTIRFDPISAAVDNGPIRSCEGHLKKLMIIYQLGKQIIISVVDRLNRLIRLISTPPP
jgi:hypothetical protein